MPSIRSLHRVGENRQLSGEGRVGGFKPVEGKKGEWEADSEENYSSGREKGEPAVAERGKMSQKNM